jgi:integral membrane protein (TIGR01906 family)
MLAVVAFVALLPAFLIAANASLVINTPPLYSYGFSKYKDQIDYYLDITDDELRSGGGQIRDYFNNDEDFIAVDVIVGGVRKPNLFNDREVAHMKDVKALVQGVDGIWKLSGLYLLGFVVVGSIKWRWSFLRPLGRYVALGGGVTLGLVALVGLGSLAGFDRLFLAFHQVSFSNDLWQLDPRTDALIAMFPQGFFFDATILIVGLTIVEALLLLAVPTLLARRAARRAAQQPSRVSLESR